MEKIIGTKNDIITSLLKLEDNKLYKIQITTIRDKKTLAQNNYLWELLGQIADKQQEDVMDVYCRLLQEAKAKYIWLKGFPETKEKLLEVFRAVEITRYEEENNKKIAIFRCYEGTSKFDKAEMQQLLEIVICWAENLGIPTIQI